MLIMLLPLMTLKTHLQWNFGLIPLQQEPQLLKLIQAFLELEISDMRSHLG